MDDPCKPVQDGIQQLLDSEYFGGGMVTSYVVVARYIDSEGQTSWMQLNPEGQSNIDTAGLIDWSKRVIDYEVQSELFAMDECGEFDD